MQLNEPGRAELRKRIVNALTNRLTLVAWEKANPGLAQASIEAPVVILGLPRAGSSILHETLAAAPGMRTPLIWQVQDFVLVHAVDDAASDVRIGAVEDEIARKNAAIPGYAAMHFENPFIPMECVALTIVDLVSTQFSTIAWAPTYRAFLLESDMRETYRWHRRALRFLQARREPGSRWVLKAPMHSLYLDALLNCYPDAVLLQTHRNPQKVVGSFCNLCATLRRAWSEGGDEAAHAQADLAYAAQLVSRAVEFRNANPGLEPRFHDVAFKHFMAEPDENSGGDFFPLRHGHLARGARGDARLSRSPSPRQARHPQLRSSAFWPDARSNFREVFRLRRCLRRSAVRRSTRWISRKSDAASATGAAGARTTASARSIT